MKSYTGTRSIDGVLVEVDGAPLPPRADIAEYSRSSYEWSYEGPEPQQLAFALLFDHMGNADEARKLSDSFMRAIVANFDNDWALTSTDLDRAVTALRAASGRG